MASGQGQRQPTNLAATFYPGGGDDFYMPEVISPAPQRVMPEVPEQIQDKLAHLELGGDASRQPSALQPSTFLADTTTSRASPPGHHQSALSISAEAREANRGAGGSITQGSSQPPRQGSLPADQPTFSHFPPLHNRPVNVPPSDTEREAILENARNPVLNSNDPEIQLTWAQDALAYVEVAAQNVLREYENSDTRPQTPRSEYVLRADALNIVSFLADQHHPKAEFIRGMWLEFGNFKFRMDKKEAFRCYARAAQKGYARAEYRMGMQYESSNEPAKAIKHYQRGVDAGDSASHYRLGMMALLSQHGQPLDYEKGIRLVTYAAETADENAPQGAYILGMLQAREIPQVNVPDQYLPLNISAARFNIEKAAYLGFKKAQTKMGAAYELCQLGCDFDPALSLHYNALAARQGEPDAEMAISKWFLCGYEGVFERNDELAFIYARRAAQSGLATAEFAMGYFSEVGIHVPVNLVEARAWYSKASEHGNKDASVRVEGISRSNTLSRKDHENVAIARIRSQYGSQRGKRPDRFQNTSTPLPTISDDGSTFASSPYQSKPSGPVRHGQKLSPSGLPQRPYSTAPYPIDDDPEPQGRLRPSHLRLASYSHPDPHQQSNSRPLSATNMGSTPSNGNYRGTVPVAMASPRLAAGYEDIENGRGRGTPAYSVIPSAPGYRQSGPTLDIPRTDSPGFFDVSRPHSSTNDSGLDNRNRLRSSNNSTAGASQPLPPISSYSNAPPRVSSRTSNKPPPQAFPEPSQTPGLGRRPLSSNRQNDSISNPPGSGPPSAINSPTLPPKTYTLTDPPVSTPPPNAPVKPPGRGPQTFEEMGVLHVKKESECALM